jgi:xylulokinase
LTELLLGIDIGTASSKAVLARPDGEIVARASREHATSSPRPGWFEHDAEDVWWADVVALCHELLPAREGNVAAVGVSGIGPCVVPCDADDRPLRPAILYGVDARAEVEVEELTALLGAEAILERGGSSLSSQALGPKLAWLRRHEPDVWERTRRWHMASSFAVARLTGTWVLDHHSASQCDPLYDLHASDWNRDWADLVAPGLPLPPLAWPGEVVGQVRAEGAAATGLEPGTPVIAGTVDAWAEATSVGVRAPGDLMLMYGSTMFLVLGVDEPSRNASIWTTRGVDPGSLTAAAGMATSGSLTAWLRDLFGGPPFDDLVDEAAKVAAGSKGLLLLPYFAGERTPIFDPNARGTVIGLTLGHDRGDLYRAALESIAYGVRHNLEAIAPGRTLRALAVGGGTRGDLWAQIVSDVTGLPQELPRETIGACYGDALLAAEGAGLVPAGTTWAVPQRTLVPRPEHTALYDELYGLYRDLYAATATVSHSLAAIQARRPPGS